MEPAGLEAASAFCPPLFKDPDDPAWKDDAGVKGLAGIMIKYVPDAEPARHQLRQSYNSAMALEAVLKKPAATISRPRIS